VTTCDLLSDRSTDEDIAGAARCLGYFAGGVLACIASYTADPTPDLPGLKARLTHVSRVSTVLRGIDRNEPLLDGILAGTGITVGVYLSSVATVLLPFGGFALHQLARGSASVELERTRLEREVRQRESENAAFNFGWWLMYWFSLSTAFDSALPKDGCQKPPENDDLLPPP
jgi:hypothetical protein